MSRFWWWTARWQNKNGWIPISIQELFIVLSWANDSTHYVFDFMSSFHIFRRSIPDMLNLVHIFSKFSPVMTYIYIVHVLLHVRSLINFKIVNNHLLVAYAQDSNVSRCCSQCWSQEMKWRILTLYDRCWSIRVPHPSLCLTLSFVLPFRFSKTNFGCTKLYIVL